ncbi:MAG: SPOUT family RNA methylase [Aigarchaeota archaeon]|nr:SPOUT family RNA methylase [Candidatus Pelearchaeum maunauluense]
MKLLVKTPLGLEEIAAARILEIDQDARLVAKPRGLEGLVVVKECDNHVELARRIEEEVHEAEHVIVFERVVEARLEEMEKAARELARDRIKPEESFAVRTVRRGSHDYRSVDVNVRVGAAVAEATGAAVNLDFPDKIVQVEILHGVAGIAVVDGRSEWRKMDRGKSPSARFFKRLAVVQMPYIGSLKGARELGARIGRAAQAYEVRELVIAPNKPCDAFQLAEFIQGIAEGIESRYEVQRKSYARHVEKVPVSVQDLYQLVRDRRGEPLIVFEPEGQELSKAAHRLGEIISRGGRVNLLFGSREGIPKGVYRAADLVIDLAPAITLPTELAAPAALTAIYTALAMLRQEQ